ncbi:MAG: sulfite exporter TauE/SafE family protein [Rubrivivax sp.]|nr:sulfite exporter TauE/SafE family protein [Rubrivivax sp.]
MLPFITDPLFYAVAVPAVLLTGLAKSGFAAGFGVLATPLMALALPAPQAAAILLPLLLAMDLTGLQQMWHDRDRTMVKRLVLWGVLGVVLGTLLVGLLSPKAVAGWLGAMTLAFLAQRLLFKPAPGSAAPSRSWESVSATLSGFTSFVAHAGSPPIMAYLLPLKLPARTLTATLAVYFAGVNAVKVVPYAALGLLDTRNLATSLLLLPIAPLGVWAGVWLVRRVDGTWFYRLMYAGMFLAGSKLLWDGLSPI